MAQNNSSNDVCQICNSADSEDICLLHEMLSQALTGCMERDLKIPPTMLPYLFKHVKFRKSMATVFDSKYLEISEKCNHFKVQSLFAGMWSNAGTIEDEKEFYKQVELGLDSLYLQLQDKQEKLRKSKDQFDILAQQLFNCDEGSYANFELDCTDEELKKNDEDDVEPKDAPIMRFNKNSNKNKFQKRSIDILKKWFLDHLENPYPDQNEKNRLSKVTGMHVRQIQNWFTNSRKRYLEPLKKKFENGVNFEFDESSSSQSSNAQVEENPQKRSKIVTPQSQSNVVKKETYPKDEAQPVVVRETPQLQAEQQQQKPVVVVETQIQKKVKCEEQPQVAQPIIPQQMMAPIPQQMMMQQQYHQMMEWQRFQQIQMMQYQMAMAQSSMMYGQPMMMPMPMPPQAQAYFPFSMQGIDPTQQKQQK